MRAKEQALKVFASHVASQLILLLEKTDSEEDKCGECLLSQTFNQLMKKEPCPQKFSAFFQHCLIHNMEVARS